jgi:integrase
MTRATTATPKKAKDGTWWFVFDSVHRKGDGSRIQIKRTKFRTKAEAKQELDRLRNDDGATSAHVEKLTVRKLFDDYIRTKEVAGRAPATIAGLRWAADIACERWGSMSAERLTHDHLDAAYADMLVTGRRVFKRGKNGSAGGTIQTDRAFSHRSVRTFHVTLKSAFDLAVNRGYLVRNPARLATPPQVRQQTRTYWTPEQVGRFLTFIHDLPCSPLPTGLVDLLVDLGARRGEALGLRWADVDLDAATITITSQLVWDQRTRQIMRRPTKRPRAKSIVSVHPETVRFLRRRRAEQAEYRLLMGAGWPDSNDEVHGDLVFTNSDGTAVHPVVFTKLLPRLSVAAGLPRITPHGLRRSFATAALTAREPVEVVAHRLGNTPRMVQEAYAHVIPNEDHGTAQRVGDLYRSSGLDGGALVTQV